MDWRTPLFASGTVQYPVCLVGNAVFLYSSPHRCLWRKQGLLQPLLRARAASGDIGRKAQAVEKFTAAQIFAQPVVPVWVSPIFHDDVRPDAVQYIPGIYGSSALPNRDAPVGVQAALAVGGRQLCGSMDRAVCLWLFWRDAHLHRIGTHNNGTVSSQILVRLLPYGNYDAGYLQIKEWKEGQKPWRIRQK